MKKLIIWDFDGVISDSEHLWVQAWCEVLKKDKGIILTNEQARDLLMGIADKTRKARIEEKYNIILDETFMKHIGEREVFLGTNYMTTMPGVEKVMANPKFEKCIATGATKTQHAWKMTQFKWIYKYMKDTDFFTVDMVKVGKPAPDIFLLAAKTKGYAPKDCIVIGDGLSDFNAARAAGMDFIAFVGAEGNNTPEYRKKCEELGAIVVCATMEEVNTAFNAWYAMKQQKAPKDNVVENKR